MVTIITKEKFIETIKNLEDLNKRMSEVDNAMRKISPDFCGFFIPEVFDMVISVLQVALEDEADWIGYFVWEKDWLRDFKIGDVEVDGEPVKIYGWGDVYDFITRKEEENDCNQIDE